MMLPVTPSLLLKTWDQGSTLHPIDRTLLLVAQARTDIPADLIADLPLGFINRTLMQMRLDLFGSQMSAVADCSHCHEALDISLDLQTMLTQLPVIDNETFYSGCVLSNGYRFRLPNSRDLAVISQDSDSTDSALQLLQRCCIGGPDDESLSAEMMDWVSASMEEIDPALDINCSLVCDHCGVDNTYPLDIASYLWQEIESHAQKLLREIHILALSYGWSEEAILSLTQQRRQQYINMVTV